MRRRPSNNRFHLRFSWYNKNMCSFINIINNEVTNNYDTPLYLHGNARSVLAFNAIRSSKSENGGYLSAPTNIHQNKIGRVFEALIFQALELSFWLPKCQQSYMKAYRITNLATQQLVHTLTDTLNCF